MSDNTKIEWTEATWNPVRGCSRVSEGCRNCYAERQAIRHAGPGGHYEGLVRQTSQGPKWTGEIRVIQDKLVEPLRWRRPRRIFVNSMSDLFHESLPIDDIAIVVAYIAATYWHTHQVLTKRPQIAREILSSDEFREIVASYMHEIDQVAGECGLFDPLARRIDDWRALCPDVLETWPLPNLWLGVSVEDQATANERIPILLDTPAALRWVSAEPLLGLVGLRRPDFSDRGHGRGWIGRDDGSAARGPTIDWVVAGGESGPAARPSHPEWFRSLRDQCAKAGVPFLFKQWGEWAPAHPLGGLDDAVRGVAWHSFAGGASVRRAGKKAAGRTLDGVVHDEFPEESA